MTSPWCPFVFDGTNGTVVAVLCGADVLLLDVVRRSVGDHVGDTDGGIVGALDGETVGESVGVGW